MGHSSENLAGCFNSMSKLLWIQRRLKAVCPVPKGEGHLRHLGSADPKVPLGSATQGQVS